MHWIWASLVVRVDRRGVCACVLGWRRSRTRCRCAYRRRWHLVGRSVERWWIDWLVPARCGRAWRRIGPQVLRGEAAPVGGRPLICRRRLRWCPSCNCLCLRSLLCWWPSYGRPPLSFRLSARAPLAAGVSPGDLTSRLLIACCKQALLKVGLGGGRSELVWVGRWCPAPELLFDC